MSSSRLRAPDCISRLRAPDCIIGRSPLLRRARLRWVKVAIDSDPGHRT